MKLHPAVSVLIAVTAAIIAGAIAALFLLTLATPSEGPPVPALRGAPHAASHVWGAPLPPTAETGAIPGSVMPMSATSLRDGRTGTIAHTGSRTPYLAIPIGPGVRVRICAVRCLDATSSDAGPNHDMLVAGRIADLDIGRWETVCGLPASRGLCAGSWHVIGAAEPTLPPTDTGGQP